jgi:hypothetical protein
VGRGDLGRRAALRAPGHPPLVRGWKGRLQVRTKLQRHVLICMRKRESRGSAGGPERR